MDDILFALENVNIEDPDSILPDAVRTAFDKLLSDSLAPEKPECQDRQCEEKDFTDFRILVEPKLRFIRSFLTKINLIVDRVGRNKLRLKKNTVVLLVILCGEHMGQHAWSSEECKLCANDILELTYKLHGCSQLKDLLVRDQPDSSMALDPLFKPIILSLRPKLLKDSWKKYPSAVACFCWLLPHVKSPHLSDHLDSVLPTALILVDDFISDYRLLGVNCLYHIVDNVPRTQLCWYGRAEVAYEALYKIVYHRDEMLATPVLSCLTLIVEKLEGGPESKERQLEWTRRDEALQLVLQQMEMEQRLALRAAYARALLPLVEALGPAAVRWARRLVRVAATYLEAAPYDDAPTTRCVLQVVEALVRQSGPRAEGHAPRLAGALLRLLADATDAGPSPPHPDLAALAEPAAAALRALLAAAPRFATQLAAQLRPPPPPAPPALSALLEAALAPYKTDAPPPHEGSAGAAA